jgi:tetratricopeptide (TPR) repeat protein
MKLSLRKFAYVFGADTIWLNYSYLFFARDAETLLRVLIVGPWLLVPLGLVGLIVAAPRLLRPQYIVWASFVPLYAIAVAIFFVADRYTLPLLIVLSVGGGAAVDWLWRAAVQRFWKKIAVMSGAAFALFLLIAFAARPVVAMDGVEEERTRMAERLVTLGRYDEAEEWAERASKRSSRPGLVHFRVGQRLLAGGETARAIIHFETAVKVDPGQPEVEFTLGEALINAGRPQDAIEHLRRAINAGLRNDVVGPDLVRALGETGDQSGAIAVLRTLSPLQINDGPRWVELGELGMQLRDATLAGGFFRRAVEARPELASAHFGLAAAAASTGRISEARFETQETLRLEPGSERARQLQQALK